MKAVILAGGRGTRLQEETDVIPKPMVRVGGIPLIEHIMRIYAAHGVSDFVVALGYRGEIIKEYFARRHLQRPDLTIEMRDRTVDVQPSAPNPWDGWRVHLIDTGQDTQTGGRIGRLREWLVGDTFCLT
jgi:glucose-1-phosphate cytidylyltransferase